MPKRLNDTAAIVTMPHGGDNDGSHEHYSRTTRKIANGFVTCVSRSRNGHYESTETFSEGSPNHDGGGNSMSKAKAYLGRSS